MATGLKAPGLEESVGPDTDTCIYTTMSRHAFAPHTHQEALVAPPPLLGYWENPVPFWKLSDPVIEPSQFGPFQSRSDCYLQKI